MPMLVHKFTAEFQFQKKKKSYNNKSIIVNKIFLRKIINYTVDKSGFMI